MSTILTDDECREIAKAADADSSGVASFEYRLIGLTEAAVLAKLPAVVPPGYKLVPVEPTEKMIRAVCNCNDIDHQDEIAQQLRDAIEAAPEEPPTPQADPQRVLVAFARFCKDQGWPTDTINNSYGSAPDGRIYTDPRTRAAWNWETWRHVMLAAAPAAPAKAEAQDKRYTSGGVLVPNDIAWGIVGSTGHGRKKAVDALHELLKAAPEAPALPADVREAIKVAREALEGAKDELGHHRKSPHCDTSPQDSLMGDIDAAIARLDALGGGE